MSGIDDQDFYHYPSYILNKEEETDDKSLCEHRFDLLDSVDLNSGDEEVAEYRLSNGDIYVGSLLRNLPDKFGKYLWSDGCMYEGDWANGKQTGKGKISWPSGATYEGDFMAGYIHGTGAFMAVNHGIYKGGWYVDERKGFGTKSYTNGDFYEGGWNQGLPDGNGRYVWKNGNEYVGEWKLGAMSGAGILRWVCGDKYDGQWQNGLKHGHGIYTWADGSRYEGTWKKGLKEGKGCFFPPRRRFSNSHMLHIDARHSATAFPTSPRRLSSCASESERFLQGLCRASSHGSFLDTFSDNEALTDPEIEKRSPSFEIRTDAYYIDEKVPRIEQAIDDLEESVIQRYHLMEEATYVSSVVKREYVQGILINEIMTPNAILRAKKPLRRWHRRRSREPVRPGETIMKGHQSYNLMLNLQFGIRYSIGKITPEPDRELSPSDFGIRARIWMHFPREGSQFTTPHESVDFKWKDYCPMVFRHLRKLFAIDSADYMLSICGDSALRELSSPGKSGSVFYLSNDDRFMIKTMRKAELRALIGMLRNYYDHVRMFENTLIVKFFGLHRIKHAGGQKVRFVVMGNVFCTELRIHRKFDLKGSSHGRSADKLEMDENTTLKDLDLDFLLWLEPSWRMDLLRQIDNDCKFLEKERIMDYSFLLGIHFRAPQFLAVFSSSSQTPASATGEKVQRGLYVVTHEPDKNPSSSGSHVRGSPLKTAAPGNEEVDLLLPGTARLRIQLGVNMPARADRRPDVSRGCQLKMDQTEESYDVVLYFGIIDILQEYDIGKRLEHAYKSLHFDARAISAVDPIMYASRFQRFLSQVFPKIKTEE